MIKTHPLLGDCKRLLSSRLLKLIHLLIVKKYCIIPLILLFSSPSMAGWEVQFIDKFEGTSVNWNNWTAQIQASYNNEIQCYTDDESSANKNFDVSNGTLKIIARRQSISCPGLGGQQRAWTSGRLNSKDKREFLYGRIEARIRFLDLELGTWPAFWMLENRIAEDPFKGDGDNIHWPNPGAGEIDVWEWFSSNGGQYITNFFNTSGCGAEHRPTYAGGSLDVQDFHTYAIEWDANDIRFYMDENVVASYDVSTCGQYKESMFVLLNVAIGGNLGGAVDPALNTATMEIDYLAHCSATNDNSSTACNESTPIIADDDNDGINNNIDQCPDTPTNTAVDTLGCELAPVLTEPSEAAPTPNDDANHVISLFSDTYNNINGIDYNPNWAQATSVTRMDIMGNDTLKYTGLNYQGTDFSSNHQNVSDMASLHIDYWTGNASSLSIYLISPGPVETAYALNIEKGVWQSENIALSEFSGVDLADTFQLKIVGNGTVFIDNIYFISSQAPTQENPDFDSDSDGVNDSIDLCPNSLANIVVDTNGCAIPEVIPPELNVAPVVHLNLMQNGQNVTTVYLDGGEVVISSTITDSNVDDDYTLNWNLGSLPIALPDVVSNLPANISFQPADFAEGIYTVTLAAHDNGAPVLSGEDALTFTIAASPIEEPPAEVPTDNTDNNNSGDGTDVDSENASNDNESSGGSLGLFWLLLLTACTYERNSTFYKKMF